MDLDRWLKVDRNYYLVWLLTVVLLVFGVIVNVEVTKWSARNKVGSVRVAEDRNFNKHIPN